MLNVIKSYIEDAPNITFNEFYIQHILTIQDLNIDFEFRRLLSINVLSVKGMEQLLNETIKELM